ncbi:MAG: hypothetical protein EOO03_13865, partial [Chitinophagaceae bacterium]
MVVFTLLTLFKVKIMKTSKIKFLPAILAASVLSLTSCENNELETMQQEAEVTQSLSNEVTPGSTPIEGSYIVVYNENVAESETENSAIVKGRVLDAMKSFKGGVKGFSAKLSAAEAEELKKDSRVAIVEQDQEVNLYGSVEVSGTSSASSTQVPSWGATKVGIGNGA